ncbi:MAG: alpha/beta hydrolase [Anaerolineae bacterium]
MNGHSPDLHYLVRQPDSTTTPAPVLILLHGVGSNERDLFSLASRIPANWLVVSARGPIPVGPNQFKWFEAMQTDGNYMIDVESERQARQIVLRFIDAVVSQHNADRNAVVAAGFSQGAALSLNLMMTEPENLLASGVFSGRIMDEIKPQFTGRERLQGKQVFLGFGTLDPYLPIKFAEKNRALLQTFGMKVTLSIDEIGHSVSQKEWDEFVVWLNHLSF